MTKAYRIAQEFDRVRRKMDAQMSKHMPALDDSNIGHTGTLLLLQLADNDGASIQAIADKMGRDHSQTARVIKQLEAKGAITRGSDPADKRASRLYLTASGDAHLGRIRHMLSDVVDVQLGPLSDDEASTLLDLLRKL